MSLINDALKKAAKQRAQEQADVIPPMPGGGGGSYSQGRPKSMQTMVLIGAGAIALIVVSVVITGMMLTRTPETKPATAVVTPAPLMSPLPAPQAVVAKVEAPIISLPQVTPAPRVVIAPALPKPTPTPVAIARVEAPAPAPAAAPAPSLSAQAAQAQSDAIQATVDSFLISGVRAAGDESKALINGHVYRVNDLIDRSLGLKLVKVEQDRLTFVDRTGSTFVKTF
jgi:hypothetical protein